MYTWSQTYSIGQHDLDLEHKQFIDKINQFEQAGKEGKSTEKVGEVLQFLVNYAQHHFEHEETFMSESHYPELEPHMRAHMSFVSRLVEFKAQLMTKGSSPELAAQIGSFCGDWLINHIMTMDLAYVRYTQAKPNLVEGAHP